MNQDYREKSLNNHLCHVQLNILYPLQLKATVYVAPLVCSLQLYAMCVLSVTLFCVFVSEYTVFEAWRRGEVEAWSSHSLHLPCLSFTLLSLSLFLTSVFYYCFCFII